MGNRANSWACESAWSYLVAAFVLTGEITTAEKSPPADGQENYRTFWAIL
jgi:hypothetical protein